MVALLAARLSDVRAGAQVAERAERTGRTPRRRAERPLSARLARGFLQSGGVQTRRSRRPPIGRKRRAGPCGAAPALALAERRAFRSLLLPRHSSVGTGGSSRGLI